VILSLFFSGNAYAEISEFQFKNKVSAFNKWLYQNGHYDLVEKVESENMILYKNKYEIYNYPERHFIPEENPKPRPNYMTLAYEFFRYSIFEKPKSMKN
jgi:hypothetical protein